jgi:hypothetical protein
VHDFLNCSAIWFGSIESRREFINKVGAWVEAQQYSSSSSKSICTHAPVNCGFDFLRLLFNQLGHVSSSLNSARFWSMDSSTSRLVGLRLIGLRHGDWWDRK